MVEVVLTSKDDALVKLLTDEVGHLTADVARLTTERDEALTMLGRDQILRVEAEAERDEARRELAALKSSFELVRNANRKVSADLAAANRVLDALARERP